MTSPLRPQKDKHKEGEEPVPQTRNATYRPYSYRRNGTALSNYTDLNMNKDPWSSQQAEEKISPAMTVNTSTTDVNRSGGPILKGPSFSRHHSYHHSKLKLRSNPSSNPKSPSKITKTTFQTKYNKQISRPIQTHKWTRNLNNDNALTSTDNINESSYRPPDSDHYKNIKYTTTHSKSNSQLPSMTKVKNNALVLCKNQSLQKDKELTSLQMNNTNTTDTTTNNIPDFVDNRHKSLIRTKNSDESSLPFYNNNKRNPKQGFRNNNHHKYNGDGVAKRIRLKFKNNDHISNKYSSITIDKKHGCDNNNNDNPKNVITKSDHTNDKKDIKNKNHTKALLTDFAYVSSTSSNTNNNNRHPNSHLNSLSTSNSNYKKNRGLIRVQPDVLNTPICKTFAHGMICINVFCSKRHDVPAEAAMPLCSYFQRNGQCLKNLDGTCPFRHVKVNPSAMDCPSFSLLGFCENKSCVMKHNKTRTQYSSKSKFKNNRTTNTNKN